MEIEYVFFLRAILYTILQPLGGVFELLPLSPVGSLPDSRESAKQLIGLCGCVSSWGLHRRQGSNELVRLYERGMSGTAQEREGVGRRMEGEGGRRISVFVHVMRQRERQSKMRNEKERKRERR